MTEKTPELIVVDDDSYETYDFKEYMEMYKDVHL
jgi:hypothetical protein